MEIRHMFQNNTAIKNIQDTLDKTQKDITNYAMSLAKLETQRIETMENMRVTQAYTKSISDKVKLFGHTCKDINARIKAFESYIAVDIPTMPLVPKKVKNLSISLSASATSSDTCHDNIYNITEFELKNHKNQLIKGLIGVPLLLDASGGGTNPNVIIRMVSLEHCSQGLRLISPSWMEKNRAFNFREYDYTGKLGEVANGTWEITAGGIEDYFPQYITSHCGAQSGYGFIHTINYTYLTTYVCNDFDANAATLLAFETICRQEDILEQMEKWKGSGIVQVMDVPKILGVKTSAVQSTGSIVEWRSALQTASKKEEPIRTQEDPDEGQTQETPVVVDSTVPVAPTPPRPRPSQARCAYCGNNADTYVTCECGATLCPPHATYIGTGDGRSAWCQSCAGNANYMRALTASLPARS